MNYDTPSQLNIHSHSFPLGYYLFCLFLYILALPLLLLSSLRAKHKDSIPSRFFIPKSLPCSPNYWFHACSFGEVRSLEPLINELRKHCSNEQILITTITQTGFAEANKLYANDHIFVRYLPFEIFLPLWSRQLIGLKTLVVLEAEMWKMLFYIAKSKGARTILLNARISNRSLKNYERFAWFYRKIFILIDCVFAQSKIDKQRLENIGARYTEVFGNLKSLNVPRISCHYIKPTRPIFIGASTHKGEEKLILQSFQALIQAYNTNTYHTPNSEKNLHSHILETSPLLLLAPRHPERFDEVYEQSKSYFSRVSRFSHNALEGANNDEVVVIDTLGELINLYAIADVVILGGSFVENVGGHNPLEPAYFGVRLISGEHIFNQSALFEELEGYVLLPHTCLADTLLRWEKLMPSRIHTKSSDKLASLLQYIMHKDSK